MSRLALLIVLVLALLGAWWLLGGFDPQTSSSQAGTEEDGASQRGDPMHADAESAGEDDARRGGARLEGSEPADDAGARKSTGSEKHEPATVRFQGVTQNADGTVVGGVRIEMVRNGQAVVVVSRADGSFEEQIPAGRYTIVALGDRQVLGGKTLVVDGDNKGSQVVKLDELGALLVRAPKGRSGATIGAVWLVRLWSEYDPRRFQPDLVRDLGDGDLRFDGLVPGRRVLAAYPAKSEAGKWTVQYAVTIVGGETTELNLRPIDTGRLAVRVLRRSEREAIPNARFTLRSSVSDGRGQMDVSGVTNEQGVLELTIPAGQPQWLLAQADGYASYGESDDDPGEAFAAVEELMSSGEADVEILLGKGARVTGRVVDETGAPVEVTLLFLPERVATGQVVTSSRTGHFECPDVLSGEYVASVPVGDWTMLDPGGMRLSIDEGQDVADLEIRVTRTITLRGQVVDADGKPAPGARVWFVPSGQEDIATHEDLPAEPPPFEVFASEDGSFAIAGVHPGVQGVLRASRGDMQAEPVQVEPVDGRLSEAPRRLVLQGAPRLTLTVLDQERRSPVANAPIRISPMDPGTQGGIVEVVSDAKGICVVAGLVPGEWRFSAKETAGRFPPQEGRIFDVTREPMEITIEVDTGLVFEGAVVDAGLDPIKDATVHVHRVKDGRRTHAWHARTDASGRFDLQGIYAGDEYVLEIKHPQFVPYVREDIQVSQRGLRIGLEARAK